MLGGAWAASRPRGLQRLVLASGLASKDFSLQSIELRKNELPPDMAKALDEGRETMNFDSPAYKEALGAFQQRYLCHADPPPPELMATMRNLMSDRTVNETM